MNNNLTSGCLENWIIKKKCIKYVKRALKVDRITEIKVNGLRKSVSSR